MQKPIPMPETVKTQTVPEALTVEKPITGSMIPPQAEQVAQMQQLHQAATMAVKGNNSLAQGFGVGTVGAAVLGSIGALIGLGINMARGAKTGLPKWIGGISAALGMAVGFVAGRNTAEAAKHNTYNMVGMLGQQTMQQQQALQALDAINKEQQTQIGATNTQLKEIQTIAGDKPTVSDVMPEAPSKADAISDVQMKQMMEQVAQQDGAKPTPVVEEASNVVPLESKKEHGISAGAA